MTDLMQREESGSVVVQDTRGLYGWGRSILLERKLNVVLVWGRGARVSGS